MGLGELQRVFVQPLMLLNNKFPLRSAPTFPIRRQLDLFAKTLIAGFLFLVAPMAHGQLPVIGLRSLSQSFFAPGEEYEVGVAEGTHTEEIRDLLFSHPGLSATILRDSAKPFAKSDSPRFGNFRVAVSPDTPEGRYEIRAVGRFGISNPRSILIQDGIRIVTEKGHDPSSANPLELGVIHCRMCHRRSVTSIHCRSRPANVTNYA